MRRLIDEHKIRDFDDACVAAIESGRLKMVQFFVNRGVKDMEKMCLIASKAKQWEILDYLGSKRGLVWT